MALEGKPFFSTKPFSTTCHFQLNSNYNFLFDFLKNRSYQSVKLLTKMVRSWTMSLTWGPPCLIGVALSTFKVDFQLKVNTSLMSSSVILSIGRCHNSRSWACNDYFNWTSFIVERHIRIVDRWNVVCVSNVNLWGL